MGLEVGRVSELIRREMEDELRIVEAFEKIARRHGWKVTIEREGADTIHSVGILANEKLSVGQLIPSIFEILKTKPHRVWATREVYTLLRTNGHIAEELTENLVSEAMDYLTEQRKLLLVQRTTHRGSDTYRLVEASKLVGSAS